MLGQADVGRLIAVLAERGYQVVGPTVRDGAIMSGPLSSVEDLPIGWTDVQEAGSYRLEQREDAALFGYVVGPDSPKRHFHPPEAVVWSGTRTNGSFEPTAKPAPQPIAYIGVRPCELAAVAIQDEAFAGPGPHDVTYSGRREGSVLVAVDCTEPGETCFCVSTATGPGASEGFDIALTEIEAGTRLVARSGSALGAELLDLLDVSEAAAEDVAASVALVESAVDGMGRTLDVEGIKELLYESVESPVWDEIAARCLTCANCTMVCPTCFCSTVEDRSDLTGSVAERVRRWDSCFNFEFSYIHGGPLRPSAASRYRQWMTHKLASWQDQFGMIGCVGCGRCITWCPVGIDITAEVRTLRNRRLVDA